MVHVGKFYSYVISIYHFFISKYVYCVIWTPHIAAIFQALVIKLIYNNVYARFTKDLAKVLKQLVKFSIRGENFDLTVQRVTQVLDTYICKSEYDISTICMILSVIILLIPITASIHRQKLEFIDKVIE